MIDQTLLSTVGNNAYIIVIKENTNNLNTCPY